MKEALDELVAIEECEDGSQKSTMEWVTDGHIAREIKGVVTSLRKILTKA